MYLGKAMLQGQLGCCVLNVTENMMFALSEPPPVFWATLGYIRNVDPE